MKLDSELIEIIFHELFMKMEKENEMNMNMKQPNYYSSGIMKNNEMMYNPYMIPNSLENSLCSNDSKINNQNISLEIPESRPQSYSYLNNMIPLQYNNFQNYQEISLKNELEKTVENYEKDYFLKEKNMENLKIEKKLDMENKKTRYNKLSDVEINEINLKDKDIIMKLIYSQNIIEGYWDINEITKILKEKYIKEFVSLKKVKVCLNDKIISCLQ